MRYPSVIRVIRVLSVRYSCIIAFIVRTPPSVQYPLLPSIFLRVRIDSLASLTFWSLYSPHACVVSDRCSLFALLHLSRIVSPNFVSSLSVIVRSRCRPPVIAIESFGRGLSEIADKYRSRWRPFVAVVLDLLISVLLAPTITHHPWPLSPRYFRLLFVYAGRRISRPSSPRY